MKNRQQNNKTVKNKFPINANNSNFRWQRKSIKYFIKTLLFLLPKFRGRATKVLAHRDDLIFLQNKADQLGENIIEFGYSVSISFVEVYG